jgi:hypothetical protein
MHTTNYINTFIEVAEDCPVTTALMPPDKAGEKTIAGLQFEIVKKNPYRYTSDDVIFQVHAQRNEITKAEMAKERELFFSKGQPCFRSSPLAKRYGWGVHSDAKGRIAIYPMESAEYQKLSKDKNLEHVKAMRSKRAK